MFDTSQKTFTRLAEFVSERTSPVVFWIGAGMSRSAGLPLWNDLRRSLVEELREVAVDAQSGEPNSLLSAEPDMDHWTAFQRLREVLKDKYYSNVRSMLNDAVSCKVPEALKILWEIDPRGMISLNIDRLASRSFAEVFGSRHASQICGKQLAGSAHILSSTSPFIVDLHGYSEDKSTWVFGKDELDALHCDATVIVIKSIIINYRIVFVGVSADDPSVRRIFSLLRGEGVTAGEHYWFTDRKDSSASELADDAGIHRINYSAPSGDHSELLQALKALRDHRTQEQDAPPAMIGRLNSPSTRKDALASPDDLARESPESIRMLLYLAAEEILASETQDSIQRFDELRVKYARAIHNAWYATISGDDRFWFEHELIELIGSGEFGSVYKAMSIEGQCRAVKILHEIRPDDAKGRLGAFRRGVRSMKILEEAKVPGMVRVHVASEVPAFAIMDFVEGPNLEDAVLSGKLEVEQKFDVLVQLVSRIRTSHNLPQRVLHRDIRPPNVMLEDFWSTGEVKVVVLDFDLSWHKDAQEKSAQLQASHGYIAPEQMQNIPGASSRRAAVDAYGIGMTMFFVFAARHPTPGCNRSPRWNDELEEIFRQVVTSDFTCAPRKLARLVARATEVKQSDRPDILTIELVLSELRSIQVRGAPAASVDVWAEEVLARLSNNKYSWSDDEKSGEARSVTGSIFRTSAQTASNLVALTFVWASQGLAPRRSLRPVCQEKGEKVVQRLRSAGWTIRSHSCGEGTFSCTVDANPSRISSKFEKMIESSHWMSREFGEM